ncbi:DUF6538 domain-containing protein [Shewanella indica]
MSLAKASNTAPYLYRSRHGVWYARVVVPEDRRDAIGKRELRKTLATKDKREAVLRSWDVLKVVLWYRPQSLLRFPPYPPSYLS